MSDAFLLLWMGALMYIFPPIPLIHKGLIKIKCEKANVILIALT